MQRIINLVGARPQFIKAAAISQAMLGHATEILVHSGQHYSEGLSDVFFRELRLPQPSYHLGTPVGTSEVQLAHITTALVRIINLEKPSAIVVYGDTTTTLAGARAAHQTGTPLAHIEAGLRSYNPAMPEENNRVQTDRLSTFLYVPTAAAIDNLTREGLVHNPPGRHVVDVGDVMLDCLRIFGASAQLPHALETELNPNKKLILLTLHRNFNADNPEVLRELLAAFDEFSGEYQVVFPVHPRTRQTLDTLGMITNVVLIPPVSYFAMLALEKRAALIITDSGGVQKEAFYFKKPLIILRPETEWTELVAAGVAKLCAINKESISAAIHGFRAYTYPALPAFYGNGYSAQKIVQHLLSALKP